MFSKWKSRLSATRFEFLVHVHTLQPWPTGSKAVAIGWQRGKRRRGATNSVLPLPNKEGQGTVVRFNEKFTLTSTLYKAPGAPERSASHVGPFKKKCLILAVLETDGRTHATAALGRIVIDLSEFASLDGQELRTFTVACNKSIHAAVGEPNLTVTIRCRWKKAGADMTEDEVASMSTDTTGSNLTTNIRDFFTRAKGGGHKSGKEQDLKGFGAGDNMATIGEEESPSDEEGGGLRAGHTGAYGSNGQAPYGDADDADFDSTRAGSMDGAAWGAQDLEYDAVGALNLHDDDEYDAPGRGSRAPAGPGPGSTGSRDWDGRSSSVAPSPSGPYVPSPSPLLAAMQKHTQPPPSQQPSQQQQQQHAQEWEQPPAPPTVAKPKSRWRMQGVDASGSGSRHSASSGDKQAQQRPSQSSATQTELADLTPVEPQLDDVTSLQDELLLSAANEFAIYNAHRHLLPGRCPVRAVHAPARRVARTLVCLGRQDGMSFGQLALRQISACVVSGRADIKLLAFWWTNSVHLRGFLQSLNLGMDDGGDMMPRHWASEAFVPRLLQQEKFIFDELVSYVWTHTFVPAVAASRARPANAALAAGVVKRSGQEAALRKWLGALEAVAAQLQALGRDGHTRTLRHQVLLEVMKRMDVLIFHFLINPPAHGHHGHGDGSEAGSSGGGPASHHPDSPTHHHELLRDPVNPNMPMLDDSMLFFVRGVLTFGTGMNLKMACTRFQQWAFGDGCLREIWANLPTQGQALFPLLRSTSDLLMMPKDLLLEEGIRADMCASLPLDTLVFMLNRFAPDDFSKEGIPADILATLRAESLAAGLGDGARPPELEVEGECTYYSPTDDMAMEHVEAGEEPGLEYDADSEEELDALGGLCTEPSSGLQPPLRFKLLHNMWCAGVPRGRVITIVRGDSVGEAALHEHAAGGR